MGGHTKDTLLFNPRRHHGRHATRLDHADALHTDFM